MNDASWSNGRMRDFESHGLGSNPSEAAMTFDINNWRPSSIDDVHLVIKPDNEKECLLFHRDGARYVNGWWMLIPTTPFHLYDRDIFKYDNIQLVRSVALFFKHIVRVPLTDAEEEIVLTAILSRRVFLEGRLVV